MEDSTVNSLVHPDWEKEHSLTSPQDRNPEKKWRPDQSVPVLTNLETKEAMKSLNDTSFISKFPRVDRTYQDPSIQMQNFGLISFTPAKGAKPNERGIYGMCKLRGNYASEMEADQRAEFLIRNFDSYHKIYHTYVGRPFPITISPDYSAETSEVDIRRDITQTISNNVKTQKDEEQRTIREMKEKEEQLLAESEKARKDDGTGPVPETDAYDEYITLCTKKAQLSWTFLEHLKKLKEVREIIVKTRAKLVQMNAEHPEFKDKYMDKYMEARKKAGLDERIRDVQDNFIKYMVEEANIPTIDTDEILPEIK